MSNFYDETRSTATVHSTIVGPVFGRTGDDIFASYPPLNIPDVIRSAWSSVNRAEDPTVGATARELLSIIYMRIVFLQQIGYDFTHLPPLKAFHVEDGSMLLEWIFDDVRVGFTIETTLNESGWYIVSAKDTVPMSLYGYLASVDLEELVHLILDLILYAF